MNHKALILLLLPCLGPVLGGLAPSRGLPVSNQELRPHPAFEPLAFLVGRAWVAEFPGGGGTQDIQEFEWMYGGQFLRNVHRVEDAQGNVVYGGETIYAFDTPSQSIRWWYFNATGGYLTGSAEIDGDLVATEGVNHAGGNQPEKVKGELHLGQDEWSSTSFFWTDGEWRERFTMHFLPLE